MQLENEFVVAASFEETWRFLLDPESVAPCLPGVTLDSVGGNVFAGRWKIKIGPITVTYRGTARLVEAEASTGTLVLEASGKESRGEGTARGTIRIKVTNADGSTRVLVRTDLRVGGRAGDFDANVVVRAGNRIFERFAACAGERITDAVPGTLSLPGAPPDPVPVEPATPEVGSAEPPAVRAGTVPPEPEPSRELLVSRPDPVPTPVPAPAPATESADAPGPAAKSMSNSVPESTPAAPRDQAPSPNPNPNPNPEPGPGPVAESRPAVVEWDELGLFGSPAPRPGRWAWLAVATLASAGLAWRHRRRVRHG